MRIAINELGLPKHGAVAIGVLKGKHLTQSGAALDAGTGGAISRAMRASRFDGEAGRTLEILAPPNLAVSRVLLVGLGQPAKLDAIGFERLAGKAGRHRRPVAGRT